MDEQFVIEIASDVAIGDIDKMMQEIYAKYGWAISDIYPVRVIR
jgi:hypothetical protein